MVKSILPIDSTSLIIQGCSIDTIALHAAYHTWSND